MADAKAMVDAAKTPENRLNAFLREYELLNSSVDKDVVKRQVEDLKATIKKKIADDAIALANEANIKKLQESLLFKYNPDIKYKAGPQTPFIRIDAATL